MTWTRLDDSWTDDARLGDLDFACRWHYLAMIQFCCRNGRLDGVIRHVDARRASDHPEPARALAELAAAGLIAVEGGTYRILAIDEHAPPPHIVKSAEQAKVRKRRQRAHHAGDHALCLPANCDLAPGVTADVTRDTGTGRDGTGRADDNGGSHERANVIDWPTVTPGSAGVIA
ncbi:hypothetical protein [Microbacterium sp. CPCC 204701]|uniref:hypothetical protein n=1 Tax=Microbacterium sp. CPCC 204701 TaxID=2493084 RepID=UPI000FD7B914|nr:hypothetical protein [Microbacterium sp. CPCC 204701]